MADKCPKCGEYTLESTKDGNVCTKCGYSEEK